VIWHLIAHWAVLAQHIFHLFISTTSFCKDRYATKISTLHYQEHSHSERREKTICDSVLLLFTTTMADEVTLMLEFQAGAPFSVRVRIALAEKGVKYDVYSEQNPRDEIRNLLLQMNSVSKQLPTLIHNGRPVCESLIIVQYVDDVWKGKAPLLPSDLTKEPSPDSGQILLTRRYVCMGTGPCKVFCSRCCLVRFTIYCAMNLSGIRDY